MNNSYINSLVRNINFNVNNSELNSLLAHYVQKFTKNGYIRTTNEQLNLITKLLKRYHNVQKKELRRYEALQKAQFRQMAANLLIQIHGKKSGLLRSPSQTKHISPPQRTQQGFMLPEQPHNKFPSTSKNVKLKQQSLSKLTKELQNSVLNALRANVRK
jgi:hypothetical protein